METFGKVVAAVLIAGLIIGSCAIGVAVFKECRQSHSLLYCVFR